MSKIKSKPIVPRRLGQISTEKTGGPPPTKTADGVAAGEKAVDAEAMQKPSKAAQAVLGHVAKTGQRKKSAATRAALAGIDAQKPRGTGKWKKAVLAVLIGVTMLNAVVPSMAQAADLADHMPTAKQEQVLSADQMPKEIGGAAGEDINMETFNPLSLRYQNPDAMDFGEHLDHTADKLNEGANLINGEPIEISAEAGVDAVGAQAVRNLEIRLNRALDRDAVSLAHGETPHSEGDLLTQHQQDRVMDALSDFFGELPLGALGDNISGPVEAFLSGAGVDTTNLDATRLGDLGGPGGEAAKNLANEFRENNPTAFWSIVGGVGAAVATYGYLEGSDALEDLGIKPEVSASFGSVGVELEGEWGAKFEDPGVSLLGTYELGDHELGAGARFRDGQFDPKLSYEFNGDSVRADVDVTLGDTLELDSSLNVRMNGDFYGNARVRLGDPDGGADYGTLGARYRLNDQTTLGLDAGMNFDTDDFRGNLSYDYRANDNLHLHVQGGFNDAQGANVGVGLTINF